MQVCMGPPPPPTDGPARQAWAKAVRPDIFTPDTAQQRTNELVQPVRPPRCPHLSPTFRFLIYLALSLIWISIVEGNK